MHTILYATSHPTLHLDNLLKPIVYQPQFHPKRLQLTYSKFCALKTNSSSWDNYSLYK